MTTTAELERSWRLLMARAVALYERGNRIAAREVYCAAAELVPHLQASPERQKLFLAEVRQALRILELDENCAVVLARLAR